MNISRLQRFVELELQRRRLEEDLKANREEAGPLERELLQEFAADGVQNLRINGVLVYVQRELWAGIVRDDPERDRATPEELARAVEALKDAGLDDYVKETFNTQSVSAYVREQVRNAGLDTAEPAAMYAALPSAFAGTISVSEKFSLRTRKA